jgi:uncharacterized repeat protein (TIGR03803 family)
MSEGGANGSNAGTIFKMAPVGALTTLHSFCPKAVAQTAQPPSRRWFKPPTGTSTEPRSMAGSTALGSFSKSRQVARRRRFTAFVRQSLCKDGSHPLAGLVQANDGSFYGTTNSGEAKGEGTVFKMTPSGALTTHYSFCSQSGCTDGEGPAAGLV